MSDINGSGYGSSHDWQRLSTSPFRVTEYRCRGCNTLFRHAYNDRPDIFAAIEAQGIPDACSAIVTATGIRDESEEG